MNWSVSEAKAKLSQLLERARRAPQFIQNRGQAVAVVVSLAEYERLRAASEATPRSPVAERVDLAERLKGRADLGLAT